MDGGKIALVVVLIAIIAAAVWFGPGRKSGPPDAIMQEKHTLICGAPNCWEEIEKSVADWKETPKQDGKYKCSKCGEFSVVGRITCNACQAKIPEVYVPAPVSTGEVEEDPAIWDAKKLEAQKNYKCPKCGGAAYNLEDMP